MAIKAASLVVDVDADVKAAQQKLQSIDRDIQKLGKTDAEVKVEANTDDAQAEIRNLETAIIRIAGQDVEVEFDADLNPALAEMAKAERQAKELDDLKPTIEIDADATPAVAEMNKIERAAMGMSNQVTAGAASIKSQMIGIAGGVGIATAAMNLLGKGLGFVKSAVWDANDTMDQTRATLMAITKDAGETEKILGMINKEASKTPYVFSEMASAYTSLLPLSKQYNTNLQELVETAELLAASKPEQGLEGAAFALREAMSGDYMSLISRFDLPRQYINQLKAEGVPALEIVRQAMGRMGYDADILARRSQTVSAKWDTLVDDLRLGIAKVGEPLFRGIGLGIDAVIAAKDDVAGVMHDIGEIGTALSNLPPLTILKVGLEVSGDERVWSLLGYAAGSIPGVKATKDAYTGLVVVSAEINEFTVERKAQQKLQADVQHAIASPFQQFVDDHAYDDAYAGNQQALYADAERYMLLQEDIAAMEQRARDAREQGAKQERADIAENIRLTNELNEAKQLDRDAQEMMQLNDATGWYRSTLDETAQSALLASEMITRLQIAAGQLATTQGSLNDVMGAFSAQGSEYSGTANALKDAHDILIDRQEKGIELSAAEQQLLADYPELYGRITGAQEDAAVQEGLVAGAKIKVMEAQDQLNEAIARGDTDLGPYNEKLKDAQNYLSDVDPQSGAQIAIENLTNAISQDLIGTLEDLIGKIDELNGKEAKPKIELDVSAFELGVGESEQHLTEFDQSSATPVVDVDKSQFDERLEDARNQLHGLRDSRTVVTVEAHFITTGDPLAMQVYGQQTGSGYIGLTSGGRADGGYIDRPEYSLLGEEAPLHPEFVIPTNPMRRNRAMGLWLDAGRALGVRGFADGGGGRRLAGNTGGVADGQVVTVEVPVSPGGSPYRDFLDALIADLDAASKRFDDAAIDRLKNYASAAREAVGLIDDTLGLINALADTTVEYSPKIRDGISELKFMSEHVTDSVGDSAAMFSKEFVEHAKVYASAGSEAVGLIGDTLGLYSDFGETVVDYSPRIADNISALKFMSEHATRSIADSAAMFSEDALAGAKLFAETAGPVLGLLKSGVDGFKALGEFEAPGSTNVDGFVEWAVYLVNKLDSPEVQRFESEGLEQASRFSKTGGDILGILRSGVDGIRALEDFRPPDQTTVDGFLQWTDYIVTDVVGYAADRFEKEGLEQASRYADTAGDVLGLLRGAADMSELQRFIAPNQRALDAYFEFVHDTTDRIVTEAAAFETEGLDGAQRYSDTAGKVLDLIIRGSDFGGLKRYRGGLLDGIDRYLGDVKTAVHMIAEMGEELGDGLLDAEKVALKINTIVGLLTSARDSSQLQLRNPGGSQGISSSSSSSSGSRSYSGSQIRSGGATFAQPINLVLPNDEKLLEYYATQLYREERLSPVGIGA